VTGVQRELLSVPTRRSSDLAMMFAVDRVEIAERIGQGLMPVMDGLLPATLSWIPQPDLEPYRYNPDLAMQLLDEAGWVDTNGNGDRKSTRLNSSHVKRSYDV